MADITREEAVSQAKLAEQAERYDDMAASMKVYRAEECCPSRSLTS